MTKEEISGLTKDYNNIRTYFTFPTVNASESGIESILKLYPEIENMERSEQVLSIAKIIYNLSFN